MDTRARLRGIGCAQAVLIQGDLQARSLCSWIRGRGEPDRLGISMPYLPWNWLAFGPFPLCGLLR